MILVLALVLIKRVLVLALIPILPQARVAIFELIHTILQLPSIVGIITAVKRHFYATSTISFLVVGAGSNRR